MAPARMMRSFDAAHYRCGALPMRRTSSGVPRARMSMSIPLRTLRRPGRGGS